MMMLPEEFLERHTINNRVIVEAMVYNHWLEYFYDVMHVNNLHRFDDLVWLYFPYPCYVDRLDSSIKWCEDNCGGLYVFWNGKISFQLEQDSIMYQLRF